MTSAPPALPFTTADARDRGISEKRLRGADYVALFRGVHVQAEDEVTYLTWAIASLLTGPKDAVLSHGTALRAMGLRVGDDERIHLSTAAPTTSRHERIVVHRRIGPVTARDVGGLALTSAPQTFVDCAQTLGFVDLVVAGDWLIQHRHTTLDDLIAHAEDHPDGRRARRALRWLAAGSQSPRHTRIRLMLALARLPAPAVEVDVVDPAGRPLARGGLVYADWGVVVTGEPRGRERLESLGWTVVATEAGDLDHPEQLLQRVHAALVGRGYDGPAPVTSVMWHRWFPARATMGQDRSFSS